MFFLSPVGFKILLCRSSIYLALHSLVEYLPAVDRVFNPSSQGQSYNLKLIYVKASVQSSSKMRLHTFKELRPNTKMLVKLTKGRSQMKDYLTCFGFAISSFRHFTGLQCSCLNFKGPRSKKGSEPLALTSILNNLITLKLIYYRKQMLIMVNFTKNSIMRNSKASIRSRYIEFVYIKSIKVCGKKDEVQSITLGEVTKHI